MEPVDGHRCYHATCRHFVTSWQGSSFGSVWHSSSSGVGPVVRLEWRVALACYLHQAHRRTDLDIAWSGCASLGLVGTGWALPLRRMRRTGRAFRDAMKRARMAQATSTKWAIMRLGLACAPENLSRSSQPDLGIFSARREPGAHSDSELGPRWGRDSEPAPVVDVTRRRPSDSDPWRSDSESTDLRLRAGDRRLESSGYRRRGPTAASRSQA